MTFSTSSDRNFTVSFCNWKCVFVEIMKVLDFDQNAIDFAKAQNELSNGSIEYFRINVLRYKPYKYYDLIWSAGLFDYFKEKHFIYLINKYIKI